MRELSHYPTIKLFRPRIESVSSDLFYMNRSVINNLTEPFFVKSKIFDKDKLGLRVAALGTQSHDFSSN